jgi:hypothetical protein
MKDKKKAVIKWGKLPEPIPIKDDLQWQDAERQAYQRWLDSLPEPPSPDKQQAVITMFDDAIKASQEYSVASKKRAITFRKAFELANRAGWEPSPVFVEMSRMATLGMRLVRARAEFVKFCNGEPICEPKTDEWNGWL